MTRSLSNLLKSGFVAFSQNDTLVIDANKHKIITGIDAAIEEAVIREQTMEETLAEALIQDAGLDDADFASQDAGLMSAEKLPAGSDNTAPELQHMANEIVKSAEEEASDIVNRAHDEAEQLRSEAFAEAEQIRIQAKEEGYQQGYEEGSQAARQELEEQRSRFEEHCRAKEQVLQQKEKDLIQTTERKMVDWLCQMIPQITGVVVEKQRDVLLHMVNTAMQDLDNSRHFVIRVSGDDYGLLTEHKDEIYGALNPNIDLEVFEDAKLAPLQCLIETDNGIVDVSLDVQLENLILALQLMTKE
ncbi:MAG: hypothetical protein IJ801_02820 [Lachnospiraceae bacterium]|nr:hypothetical protein [Lachnospiraceae bacterium]